MHVVAGVNHFIEPTEVIAMLMTGKRVIETISRHDPDRLKIGHHPSRASSGIAGFQKYRRSIGAFHEYGASPPNVDVMNLELLC